MQGNERLLSVVERYLSLEPANCTILPDGSHTSRQVGHHRWNVNEQVASTLADTIL